MEDDLETRLSWPELKGVVGDLRRQLSGLSTTVPSGISFRSLPDGRTRIYFLSTPQNGWETTLLFADVASVEQNLSGKLPWHLVLEYNFPSGNKSSREEQMQFERRRLATWGINSYEIHGKSGKIIFPASGALFQCIDNGYLSAPLFPTKLRITAHGAKLNPLICPWDPDVVAYICNHDIWVSHTVSGCTVRLTYAHKGSQFLADDPLSAGVPSYVMQEEFSRYEGYWWQPKSTDGIFRILYEEVDDGDVKVFCFPSSQGDASDVEEFRFPRAGCANSKSYLKMVEFKVSETKQIDDVCMLELQFSLSVLFPWMEYLVRAGWTPDASNIWVQLLDRRQQRLELVLLSLNNFTEVLPMYDDSSGSTESGSPPLVQVLYCQESTVWVNVHDLLYFLTPATPDQHEVQFIWASQDTGFRHLYLVTAQLLTDNPEMSERLFLRPRVVGNVALTQGNWEVLSRDIWVDERRQLVYFMGLRETPLEKHLYVVSLKRPGEVRLLTRPGFSYVVDFNEDRSILVTTYSSIQQTPACQAFRVAHADWTVDGVALAPSGHLLEPAAPPAACPSPELYTRQLAGGDGPTAYAMVFRPREPVAGRRYPTVLTVYGGPEVQLVSNTFKGMRQLRAHLLAARGYCVVAVDSRGSQHRGLAWEGHLKGRMGTVELRDQVEVLRWLADQLQCIDMDRVAIHGWSYGGYLSLMGLAQYPDVFKIAIAGAPVTNWNLYDTGYTERYMDLPDQNPQGYQEGSVLNYVNKFPEQENRLLIIHGLVDENVHFYHSSQLINALVKAGKPYALQVYPNERHSLRHLDASKHYETTLLAFLQNHL